MKLTLDKISITSSCAENRTIEVGEAQVVDGGNELGNEGEWRRSFFRTGGSGIEKQP